MPLTYPGNPMIPTVERYIQPQPDYVIMGADWVGKYNWLYLPIDYPEEPVSRVLILNPQTTNKPDAEIIIRNYGATWSYDATGNPIYPNTALTNRSIIIQPHDGAWIEYSGKLGPYIPPGGIMELKRLGSSNTWSAYGYIVNGMDL